MRNASSTPDPDHLRVLGCSGEHVTVTAPPGTGKTYLSVNLAANFLASNPNERALLLTFSNQARTQLEREAARRLERSLRSRVEITNYHRFFWLLVKSYRRALGLPSSAKIGSLVGRLKALGKVLSTDELSTLKKHSGLIESLAELEFARFHDGRTPARELLAKALSVVRSEHLGGRLIFDDLGALCWRLLTEYRAVSEGLAGRFSLIIADEHQDSSELQDSFVRLLAAKGRLVILGDQFQLIHGFRGASEERIQRHLDECSKSGTSFTLSTPHRWKAKPALGKWTLGVRARLMGDSKPDTRQKPKELQFKNYDAQKGIGILKSLIKYEVQKTFRQRDTRTIAILARDNETVAELRGYLCRNGQFPKQIGSSEYEKLREEIERVRSFERRDTLVLACIDRLQNLFPAVPKDVFSQARNRIKEDKINFARASPFVTQLLQLLEPIMVTGPEQYLGSLLASVRCCENEGFHCPSSGIVKAMQETVFASQFPQSLDSVLDEYSNSIMKQSQVAPRAKRGLFVLTAHQSKGKEFDVVILGGLSERFWRDNPESRKLLYVSLTRATQNLIIFTPDSGQSPLVSML